MDPCTCHKCYGTQVYSQHQIFHKTWPQRMMRLVRCLASTPSSTAAIHQRLCQAVLEKKLKMNLRERCETCLRQYNYHYSRLVLLREINLLDHSPTIAHFQLYLDRHLSSLQYLFQMKERHHLVQANNMAQNMPSSEQEMSSFHQCERKLITKLLYYLHLRL